MAYRQEHNKKTLILKITSFPSPDRIVEPHEEGPAVFHKCVKNGVINRNSILIELRKFKNLRAGFYHPEDWGKSERRDGFVATLREIDGEVPEASFLQILKFQEEGVCGARFLEYIWAGIVNE